LDFRLETVEPGRTLFCDRARDLSLAVPFGLLIGGRIIGT
jgi:hypothetical protein